MENRERVRHRNQNLVDGKRQEQKTKSKKNRKVEWVEPPSVLVDSRKNVVYTKRKLLGKVSVRNLALSLSRRYSRFLLLSLSLCKFDDFVISRTLERMQKMRPKSLLSLSLTHSLARKRNLSEI